MYCYTISHIDYIIIFFLNITVFPQLYLHMFAQRRKIIGGETSKKAN